MGDVDVFMGKDVWRSWICKGQQAEWFCKVDYDTYFFPQNLKYYVNDYNMHWDTDTEYHYFGHVIQSHHNGPSMIASVTVCWSRNTLGDIANVYWSMPMGHTGGFCGPCVDRAEATEEASTSVCLFENLNVSAHAAWDDNMREYASLDRYKDVLTWNRTEQGEWWY
jgi:hypothetical protein